MTGKRLRAACVCVASLVAVASTGLASPVDAQNFSATFGQGLYGADSGCPTPGSFITTYRLSAQTPLLGVSASFNNGDYPWPPMDGGFSAVGEMLTHGDAVAATAEIYPFGLLKSEGGHRLASFVRPFVGIGLQKSKDGEPEAATVDHPESLGVVGATDLLFTYGAAVSIPTVNGLRLVVEFRGNSVFAGQYDAIAPNGSRLTADGSTLTWGELSAGFSYGVR
jgi:hypothetical protein